MLLQESLEEGYKADYPTDDGGIHPDFPAEVGVSEPRPPNFIAAIPQTSAGADSAQRPGLTREKEAAKAQEPNKSCCA